MNILEVLDDEHLFSDQFAGATWRAWKALLAALFGLPMSPRQRAIFEQCTGRKRLPTTPFREAAFIVGRKGGKSRVLALIAVYLAIFVDYRPYTVPGEVPTIGIIAADRRQARVILRYCGGLLNSVRMLHDKVASEAAELITLTNGVVIEIHTASIASPRGRTWAACLCDESAFWSDENSTNPDREVIAAVRPGLATIPTSMLILASSPYARRGVLWDWYRKHYGDADSRRLIWKAPTWVMHPKLTRESFDDDFEEDPANAQAEWGAEFRSDVESFIAREVVDACTALGLHELPPVRDLNYYGFVDPSGGSADSFTMAIAHRQDDIAVLDCIREVRPPFSPEGVVAEFAATLAAYNIHEVTGDRYGGEFPRELFKKQGITYELSDRPKSDIYRECLPILNSGRVQLLDNQRLTGQLVGLERRTARGGRDSIDHAPRNHDDVCNAVCGVLVRTIAKMDSLSVWERLAG